MSHFTVAASTSAASLGARAAAAAKRRPGSLRAKGSGGSMTRGVSLRVRAMNADEAPKKMNPEQRARAARRAKMEAEAELAEAEAEQKAEAEAKAKAAEVGIEARARASLRQKLEAELAELAAMDALEEEKLAAAEPVVPVVPVAAAATATPNAAVAEPMKMEESAESSEYKSSLFTDGAFEDALKGVNDMAEDIGVDVSDAPIDAPTIDWGGIDSVRSLTEDDPFPGFDGGVTPKADDFSPSPEPLEPAMATTVSSTPSPAVEAAMASSAADGFVPAAANSGVPALAAAAPPPERQQEQVRSFLYPGEEELPDDVNMTIWEHLEELRDRAIVSAGACGVAVLLCFCFAKDLVIFLEQPVIDQVKFLQLGPGEYFFTTVKVAGYCGLLLGAPVVLYEAIAYVVPGLTKDERKFLAPIVLGSSVLFYAGIGFAYAVLTPAALKVSLFLFAYSFYVRTGNLTDVVFCSFYSFSSGTATRRLSLCGPSTSTSSLCWCCCSAPGCRSRCR